MYQLMVNANTVHIAGVAAKDSKSGEFNYSLTACPALTRGFFAATGKELENLEDALKAARSNRRKLCKHCEKAALAVLEAATEAPTMVQVVKANPEGTAFIGHDAEGNVYDLDANKKIIGKK